MSKKTFNLITAIVGGVETIAVGVVTFMELGHGTEINSAIVIIGTAVIEACSRFLKVE